jgi:hypothetical protein
VVSVIELPLVIVTEVPSAAADRVAKGIAASRVMMGTSSERVMRADTMIRLRGRHTILPWRPNSRIELLTQQKD